MAQVTLINTVGFVAGPAIGGVLGHLDFRLPLGLALLLHVTTLSSLVSSGAGSLLALGNGNPFALSRVVQNRAG